MTWTWKKCEKCERLFPTDTSYKKLCSVCWRRTHGIELFKTDLELDQALERIKALDAQLEALAHAPKPAPRVTLSIPRDRLNALIALCHPDRHAGNARATETTKWLLSLRKKA